MSGADPAPLRGGAAGPGGSAGPRISPERIAAIERHAAAAWPAQYTDTFSDGWLLRATPGLERGRSSNALTPIRPLADGELDRVLVAATEWSRRLGTPLGMQVVPLHLHAPVIERLERSGWHAAPPVQVLAADVASVSSGGGLSLEVSRGVSRAWLRAWAACDPGRDDLEVSAHAGTVFQLLGDRALFMRSGDDAVGFAVEGDGLIGLFSLAVRPDLRRRGLGRRLVSGMLAAVHDASTVYLQVSSENQPALALYDRLGFRELYRYRHVRAPEGWDPVRGAGRWRR